MERTGFVQLVDGISQYSSAASAASAAFDVVPSSISDTSINVLQEMTRYSIDQEFNLRKQLYENREAFYDHIDLNIEVDSEITELTAAVKKGREILKQEILNYSSLKDQLEQVDEQKDLFQDQISKLKRVMLYLDQVKLCYEGYKEDLENMNTLVHNMEEKFKTHLECATKDTREHYDKTFQKLVQLKEIYQVYKDSDVSFVCPVCMSEQVQSFLIPCGHTFCKKCLPSNGVRCHICRKQYQRTNTLYFN